MSKYKYIMSAFDGETGESIVKISHNGHWYYGSAHLNPEDKGRQSSFLGCQIAELRAIKKAMNHDYKEKKKMYDFLSKYIGYCSEIDEDIKRLRKDIEYRKERIDAVDGTIKAKIDNFYNFYNRNNS